MVLYTSSVHYAADDTDPSSLVGVMQAGMEPPPSRSAVRAVYVASAECADGDVD